jgi:transketolase N-terminal domain/subunit
MVGEVDAFNGHLDVNIQPFREVCWLLLGRGLSVGLGFAVCGVLITLVVAWL